MWNQKTFNDNSGELHRDWATVKGKHGRLHNTPIGCVLTGALQAVSVSIIMYKSASLMQCFLSILLISVSESLTVDVNATMATEEDYESGNGPSLPQSPSSVEGPMCNSDEDNIKIFSK